MSQKQVTTFDQVINVAALGFFIVVLFVIAWVFARPWVVAPLFWWRLQEITLLTFILEKWTWLAHYLHLPAPNLNDLYAAKDAIQGSMYDKIAIKNFEDLNITVGLWLRYPILIIFLALSVFLKAYHPNNRFQTVYNMKNLKKEESKNWPQITPVLSVDLLKQDLDEGSWAMAKLPKDFAKQNDLLIIGEHENKKVWRIKHNTAHSVFALQLGPTWTGLADLPIEIKALIVIFITRAIRQREVANKLLSQIAASANHGKLNFSGVEDLLLKYKDHNILKCLEKRHAYVYTFLASLLEIGRSDGVLATSEFLWLKPVNRRLWYVLNSVGRMTSYVEAAGIFAHWLAEKQMGQKIKTPMVKEAVIGLEKAVEDILFIEEGDRWHINNAA